VGSSNKETERRPNGQAEIRPEQTTY